mmetsp:Transcript_3732/g.11788  ORF Transcript_3732/g.11788 Transcript_3732/m.11788 type:complete len:268 (+) Transcript_3732:2773-3576(+)
MQSHGGLGAWFAPQGRRCRSAGTRGSPPPRGPAAAPSCGRPRRAPRRCCRPRRCGGPGPASRAPATRPGSRPRWRSRRYPCRPASPRATARSSSCSSAAAAAGPLAVPASAGGPRPWRPIQTRARPRATCACPPRGGCCPPNTPCTAQRCCLCAMSLYPDHASCHGPIGPRTRFHWARLACPHRVSCRPSSCPRRRPCRTRCKRDGRAPLAFPCTTGPHIVSRRRQPRTCPRRAACHCGARPHMRSRPAKRTYPCPRCGWRRRAPHR